MPGWKAITWFWLFYATSQEIIIRYWILLSSFGNNPSCIKIYCCSVQCCFALYFPRNGIKIQQLWNMIRKKVIFRIWNKRSGSFFLSWVLKWIWMNEWMNASTVSLKCKSSLFERETIQTVSTPIGSTLSTKNGMFRTLRLLFLICFLPVPSEENEIFFHSQEQEEM